MVVSVIALLILLMTFGVAVRSARSREERLDRLDRTLHEDAERNELEARLQRSLEMAKTEGAAYDLVGARCQSSAPGLPAELLVADSSRAHFHQAASTDGRGRRARRPGCPVMSPTDCPAATWGQTQIWPSSTALDACPHLQGRSGRRVLGGLRPGQHRWQDRRRRPRDRARHAPTGRAGRREDRAHRPEGRGARRDAPGLPAFRDPGAHRSAHRADEPSQPGGEGARAHRGRPHLRRPRTATSITSSSSTTCTVTTPATRRCGSSPACCATPWPDDLTARYGGGRHGVRRRAARLQHRRPTRTRSSIGSAKRSRSRSRAGASPAFTVSFGITAARPENTFSQTLEIADAALLEGQGHRPRPDRHQRRRHPRRLSPPARAAPRAHRLAPRATPASRVSVPSRPEGVRWTSSGCGQVLGGFLLRVRPRMDWSRTTLRRRTLSGVTSTHSSSAMNSSACSSDIGRGGVRRTVSSELDVRCW